MRTTLHSTGAAAASARARKASMAADISTMATVVAAASGADHCQPIVSCDHIAAPNPRNTAAQQPNATRLTRT